MTQKKTVGESLLFLLTHPVTMTVLNRSNDISEAIEVVKGWWSYDLFKRRPGPAYYDEYGNFHCTDLDLACFLYELSKRGAVITLPTYKSKRASKVREDQQLTSASNRHGKIVGLTANKDFFSFSVKIIDENVVGENSIGDYRNFMLTDFDGTFYKGWRQIQFVPTLKENRWLTENQLFTDNKVYFDNFVAPNRWTSFFGHHYVISKMMLDRLKDEASYYYSKIKEMQEDGIRFPDGKGPTSYDYAKETGEWKKFPAHEVKVQYPPIEGEYPKYEHTQENLIKLHKLRNSYIYNISQTIRFMTRVTEMAHFKNPNRFPFWLKGAKWESGYKLPRGKIEWDRLVLFQPEVGKYSVSLLKRTYEKSVEVAT
ncbi:MAG: hypothetical protein PVG65_02730 [Candidatus Thorarchaeota archaeon]|jgi:hypothetical protein